MTQADFNPTGHPSPERLALLAQSRDAAAESQILVHHLASCAPCFGVYAEFARHHLAWLSGASNTKALQPRPTMAALPVAARTQRPRPRLLWVGSATAAALALIWFAVTWRSSPDVPDFTAPHPILLAALESASSQQLIYPGGQAGAAREAPTYRSESAPNGLQPQLDALLSEFRRGRADEAALYWLAAGNLADGQLENAHAILREARERYPESDRLQVLAGIHAYRSDRSEEAVRLFEGVVQRSPQDLVARFNLGFVLAEEGDASGIELLNQVVQEDPNAAVGIRSATEVRRFDR